MTKNQLEEYSTQIVNAVKTYVQQVFDSLSARVATLEQRPLPLDGKDGAPGERGEKGDPGPQGERGEKGEHGYRGDPGPQGEKGEKGDPGERGPQGEQGEQGDFLPTEEAQALVALEVDSVLHSGQHKALLAALVEEEVKRIEIVVPEPTPGKDGRDGVDGKDGAPGRDGIDGKDGINGKDGAPGRDGKDGKDGVDGKVIGPDEITKLLLPLVKEAVDAIPPPVDGRDGRDGRDGAPGKDAADLVIHGHIQVERSYPLGSWARHAGGLWRAARDTDPLRDNTPVEAGWVPIVEGIAKFVVTQEPDERSFKFTIEYTNGSTQQHVFKLAAMIYRGIYSDTHEYDTGDTVTDDNQTWVAVQPSKGARPGTSEAWKLAARKGRNGKDADSPRSTPRVSLK